MASRRWIQQLKQWHPFIKTPLIVSAPMRVFAGPDLAVAVSRAGGLGFIGPGARPSELEPKLAKTRKLLNETPFTPTPISKAVAFSDSLPIGVGFQLFDGDLEAAAAAVRAYRPCAAWLFVPANGQPDIDRWIFRLRKESSETKIWLQIGSVAEAMAAASSEHRPDVLVMQGIDAGGHGLKKGAGTISLLPEAYDALQKLGFNIPLLGAGGIADGRGVAAVLGTGVAAGAVMGTRFLASEEAEVKAGHQRGILQTVDGGQSTVRTTLFDQLVGRDDWPEAFDGRAIINASVKDDEAGLALSTNKTLFQEMLKSGEDGWGVDGRLTSYVGTSVGLVNRVASAEDIIEEARTLARSSLQEAVNGLIDD